MTSPMPEYQKLSEAELRELSIEAGRELNQRQAYEFLARKRVKAALDAMLRAKP